jgi:hypothetical protein
MTDEIVAEVMLRNHTKAFHLEMLRVRTYLHHAKISKCGPDSMFKGSYSCQAEDPG